MKKRNKLYIRTFALVLVIALSTWGIAGIAVLSGEGDNLAPIAEGQELTTFRNVPVYGVLNAVDPEGDIITYRVAAAPKKGSVLIEENGTFSYTPLENKKGKDSFTFVAVDAMGNASEPAKISVKIEKQSTKVSYSDMDGHQSYYAALNLAENEIFVGEQLGNSYFFNPDREVSRGEFLAMCLKLADVETLSGITRTGFADDEEIPMWVKPYVSTALMSGIIQGYVGDEGGIVFAPNTAVTMSEAAVILDNVLELSNMTISGIDEELVPAWAYQATANLTACDIISGDMALISSSKTLTRADVAEMISNAMELLNSDGGSSLLSWAK